MCDHYLILYIFFFKLFELEVVVHWGCKKKRKAFYIIICIDIQCRPHFIYTQHLNLMLLILLLFWVALSIAATIHLILYFILFFFQFIFNCKQSTFKNTKKSSSNHEIEFIFCLILLIYLKRASRCLHVFSLIIQQNKKVIEIYQNNYFNHFSFFYLKWVNITFSLYLFDIKYPWNYSQFNLFEY